jgi:hypothetical protein
MLNGVREPNKFGNTLLFLAFSQFPGIIDGGKTVGKDQ